MSKSQKSKYQTFKIPKIKISGLSEINALVYYEVCPKSNETGIIKTLLKNIEMYQSQIPSKKSPST